MNYKIFYKNIVYKNIMHMLKNKITQKSYKNVIRELTNII